MTNNTNNTAANTTLTARMATATRFGRILNDLRHHPGATSFKDAVWVMDHARERGTKMLSLGCKADLYEEAFLLALDTYNAFLMVSEIMGISPYDED